MDMGWWQGGGRMKARLRSVGEGWEECVVLGTLQPMRDEGCVAIHRLQVEL